MQVWLDAALQNFGSIGIAFGSLMAFSSYNDFHSGVIRDSLIVAVVNAATSLLSGSVIFAALGFIAHEQGIKDISLVAEEGRRHLSFDLGGTAL